MNCNDFEKTLIDYIQQLLFIFTLYNGSYLLGLGLGLIKNLICLFQSY